MQLKEDELYKIYGGITATWLNSLCRLLSIVIDLGRMVGSSINRTFRKNYC